MTVWLVLGAAIGVEVFATLGLRASDGLRKRIWIVPVVTAYLASFYLLWLVLKLGMPIGIAYGVWTACGVGLVAVIARFVFGDLLSPRMIAGLGFIVAGVLVIEVAGAVH